MGKGSPDQIEVSTTLFSSGSPAIKFEGGNISKKLIDWRNLTSDSFVLQCVKGVRLDFSDPPCQEKIPRPYRMNSLHERAINAEIDRLLQLNIVTPVGDISGHFVSNVFVRPKPNGKFRMIIDLSDMNNSVSKQHFKMQHLEVAIDMLARGCFMASIDLKDAYYAVPISVESQKYLCFQWKGSFLKFRAMPFGLTSAPRIFTKILGPIFSTFRDRGFLGFPYVNDSFIMGFSRKDCAEAVSWLRDTFEKLGFSIHPKKSMFEPETSLVFLGYRLNSVAMTVQPTEEKCKKVSDKITSVRSKDSLGIREVASLAGLLNDVCKGVDYGLSHNKNLEMDKISALRRAGPSNLMVG